MAVYNQTYNFNQGNLSFGQALLGSLTGGMNMGGCCGFGSPFSMNGSIFSMGGFGGYGCGGYSSDSMLGAQLSMIGFNCILGAISTAIEGRGSKDADLKSDEDLKSEAEKYVDDNNPELKKAVDTAKANLKIVETQTGIISDSQKIIKLHENDIEKLNKEIENKEKSRDALQKEKENTNTTPERKNEIEREIAKINKEIEAKKAELAKKEESKQKEVEKIQGAREQLAKVVDVNELVVDTIDTDTLVREAKEKVAEAEKARNDKIDKKYDELKAEQQAARRSSGSRQLDKANRKADKAEARREKEIREAEEKAEKAKAEELEKNRKEIRTNFNKALNTYKNLKNDKNKQNVLSIIYGITEDIELRTALLREFKATLPRQPIGA